MQYRLILHPETMTFVVENDPTDHMALCLDNADHLTSIGWELNTLVFVEGEYKEGDQFTLDTHEWKGATILPQVWTVGVNAKGHYFIIGAYD